MKIRELEKRLADDFKEYNLMPNIEYPFFEIWINENGNDIFISSIEYEKEFSKDDSISSLRFKRDGIQSGLTYEDIKKMVEKELNN